MDLLNADTYLCPEDIQTITNWGESWTWLAGGTWLFSEPQPNLKVLVDIQQLGWDEIEVGEDYLIIGATCPLIKLLEYSYPEAWTAIAGLKNAVTALAASSKVVNVATVGGNICLALSVGTLAPVMVALAAIYEIWNLQGKSRQVVAQDFQISTKKTILQPGEILRRVLIPLPHLQWQVNYQRFSIAATDPALAIVVTAKNHQQVRCVIAASVAAPQLLEGEDMQVNLDEENFIEDARASASYRRHITEILIGRSLSALCKNS
ncbi:FAD binding domain-containing protein [Nostoc sp. CHAB 5844]|nr:FAD binding domain-containing protein [Nostoc sp. CHAB 5844]